MLDGPCAAEGAAAVTSNRRPPNATEVEGGSERGPACRDAGLQAVGAAAHRGAERKLAGTAAHGLRPRMVHTVFFVNKIHGSSNKNTRFTNKIRVLFVFIILKHETPVVFSILGSGICSASPPAGREPFAANIARAWLLPPIHAVACCAAGRGTVRCW